MFFQDLKFSFFAPTKIWISRFEKDLTVMKVIFKILILIGPNSSNNYYLPFLRGDLTLLKQWCNFLVTRQYIDISLFISWYDPMHAYAMQSNFACLIWPPHFGLPPEMGLNFFSRTNWTFEMTIYITISHSISVHLFLWTWFKGTWKNLLFDLSVWNQSLFVWKKNSNRISLNRAPVIQGRTLFLTRNFQIWNFFF